MRYLGTIIPSESRTFLCAPLSLLGLILLLAVAAPSRAHAGDLPQIVALPPQTKEPTKDAALSRELERALLQLGQYEVMPRPAFDLEAVQLAIDCVEENVECLRQVAQRTNAQIVIAPTLERAQGAIVLSLLYFDAKTGAPPRKVSRKQRGTALDRDTFDALPGLLRQLLPSAGKTETAAKPKASPLPQLKPVPAPEPADASEADAESTAETDAALASAEEPPRAKSVPLGPILLGAGGVAMIATGAVFGALVSGAENDFSKLDIRTEADVMNAEDDIDSAETNALVANALLGAGAAVVVGAAIWLAIDLSSHREPSDVAVVPVIGKDYAGLSLSGSLGARQ
jgi:hypothetical protein